MPDLSAIFSYASDVATLLGGTAAILASWKVFRALGGMEEKFAASLKAIEKVQVELKELRTESNDQGHKLASHDATLAMLIPALAKLPSSGNGSAMVPIPDIDTKTMSELGVTINKWIAERLELERLMKEERD